MLTSSLPRTIFLVDDDPAVVRGIARMFEGFDYQVVGSASTPAEAVEGIAATRPTLALVDISLGGVPCGTELAAQLMREHQLAVVFVTGVDEPDMRPLAGSDGVFGFLTKPCRPAALRTTVELVRLQHEARGKLRALERHYHALFDQAAVGVVELDAGDGTIHDANSACARIFATDVPGMLGTRLVERTDPEHREVLHAMLAGSGPAIELPCRRDDGEVAWVRFSSSQLERERRVVIVEDITARHRAEAQLERHRRLLAESQRNAEIGSFHFHAATGEVVWSEEMYRLFGVSPSTFVPTVAAILDHVHPRDRAWVADGMSRPDDAESMPRVFSLLLADGTERVVRVTSRVIDGGTPSVSVIGTLQNVTESESAVLRERAATAANRAKTDFLAHMSHELRTPLNAVLGLSEALLEHTFGELTDPQRNTLATINGSGRHLLDLINDVLDIARVESGNLPLEPDTVQLRPLIDESTALIYGQLAAKGQRLVIDLGPALPPVDIDRRRIKQVLLNLLGNAIKFSPPGATVALRAAVLGGGREVELSVSDNGPGISATDQERVFEPFVTLDPSMTRSHDGAGLGLALAKRIVLLHGGKIRVDSEPGRGTTFTITLPCSSSYAGDAPPLPVEARRDAHAATRNTTVLLAEDNEPTILAIASYLEGQGYNVRVARDGAAALSAACDPEIGIVLMDVRLPMIDGLEVTRRIRAQPNGSRKPVIALTAHAMPGDEQRCLDAGATAYMAKPVMLRQLAVAIERLVEVP